MLTFRISADVKDDRQIVLTLPPEVPIGKAELTVTVNPQGSAESRQPRTSLAEWAEQDAEHWGRQLSSEDVENFTGRRF